MNDPALVGDRKRSRNLLEEAQAIPYGQRTPCQALAEIVSIEPLHGQEALTIGGLAMGDMGNDAGVAKLGEELRLAEKALSFVATVCPHVQELERNGVPAVAVGGAVDGAHAAAAGGTLNLEAIGKEAARRERGIPHLSQYARRCRGWIGTLASGVSHLTQVVG